MVDRCVVTTINSNGEPQARVLVLRDLNDRLALFLNESSNKHSEFQNSKTISVLIFLPSIGIQYRLSCELCPVKREDVAKAWAFRPTTSKLLDALYSQYPQSSKIPGHNWLTLQLNRLSVPKAAPNSVLGFFLEVINVDYLKLATESEVHKRFLFHRNERNEWHVDSLMP